MIATGFLVPALADYLAALHDHSADCRIGPCVPKPASRELDSPLHIFGVFHYLLTPNY
jgi:hypothetical protein